MMTIHEQTERNYDAGFALYGLSWHQTVKEVEQAAKNFSLDTSTAEMRAAIVSVAKAKLEQEA